MNNYSYKSIVSNTEAEALKEMIFNRVRARAEAMNKDVQDSYINNMQTELMDIARSSFVANKNPFSSQKTTATTDNTVEIDKNEEVVLEKDTNNYEGLSFSNNKASFISSQIKLKTENSNEEIAKSAVISTMEDAHKSLQNKTSFMGALNFLNSQASIAIVNKTGKRFEANA